MVNRCSAYIHVGIVCCSLNENIGNSLPLIVGEKRLSNHYCFVIHKLDGQPKCSLSCISILPGWNSYTTFTHSCSCLTLPLARTFVCLCLYVNELFSHAYKFTTIAARTVLCTAALCSCTLHPLQNPPLHLLPCVPSNTVVKSCGSEQ